MSQEDKQQTTSIQGDQRINIPKAFTMKQLQSLNLISHNPLKQSRQSKIVQFNEHKIQQLLQFIFEYFCKKVYQSKPMTFDGIKHQVAVLTLNKFMIFSRDFGFITTKLISMINLVTIFRKCSTNYKQMNLKQFKNSLVKISQDAFKKQEQSLRYRRLLEFMKLTNEQEFKEQMKKIKIAIPETLIISKHINNFKIHSHCGKFETDIKKQLQLRKQRKIKMIKPIIMQKRRSTLSPPSVGTTKYSQIYANKTKNRFELNNILLRAKQQTQYSNSSKSRKYSSTKHQAINSLHQLIQQDEQDQVLDQLYRRQRGQVSNLSQAIQQRMNKLQRQQKRRVATQNLIKYQ